MSGTKRHSAQTGHQRNTISDCQTGMNLALVLSVLLPCQTLGLSATIPLAIICLMGCKEAFKTRALPEMSSAAMAAAASL